jgi:hypothetical protein
LTTLSSFEGQVLDLDNPKQSDNTLKFVERLASSIESDNSDLTPNNMRNLRENIRKVMRGETLEDIFGKYI